MIKVLIAPLVALFVAVSIKILLRLIKNKKISKNLHKSGGMPSVHAAMVSALTLSLYLYQGFDTLFIITLIFSVVIIRSTMIRREDIKHKIPEIIVGIILGILISFLIYLI